MSVDARIRKGLTMIDSNLPPVDTAEGYDHLEREVRRTTHRRRALLGAAAAAVLVVAGGAVFLTQRGSDPVEPSGPPATTAFRSPLYGYSIALPRAWKVTPATTYSGSRGRRDTTSDVIRIPGTDTTISVSAADLGGQTFAAWARDLHRQILHDSAVPSGCDGGDPASWRRLPVGAVSGYLLQKCNQAIGIAPIGARVYLFVWGNHTFVEGHHYPQSRFETLLAGVTLPDAATAQLPLQPSASSASQG